jgi:hypothetical protein
MTTMGSWQRESRGALKLMCDGSTRPKDDEQDGEDARRTLMMPPAPASVDCLVPQPYRDRKETNELQSKRRAVSEYGEIKQQAHNNRRIVYERMEPSPLLTWVRTG